MFSGPNVHCNSVWLGTDMNLNGVASFFLFLCGKIT